MRVSSQIRTLHTDHGYALQIKNPPMNGKTGRSEQVQQKKMMITIIIYSHVDKLQTIHDGVQC